MSTSVSTSSSTQSADGGVPGADIGAKPNKSGDRTVKLLIIIAASVLLLVVGFFVIRIQGYVRGSEFSPTHFQQREFNFFEIPLLHIQITPIQRSTATPSTANFLRQKGLIKAPLGQPADWHLVSLQRGLGTPVDADANLLIAQIELELDSDPYWRQWSIDHPKSAAVLWSTIQTLAERELYVLMPGLFEIAQFDQNEAELQASIDEYLIDQYADLIQDMVASDRWEVAKQLVKEAKSDYPGGAPWQSFLANSNP